jgi:hypothetical protein
VWTCGQTCERAPVGTRGSLVAIMKNINLILFLTCLTNMVCGQTYDNIATQHFGKGKVELNFTDSLGFKQGIWINYKLIINKYNSELLRTEVTDTSLIKTSSGEYKNNKKIGKWEYYDTECYGCGVEKIETHNPDGTVEEIKYSRLCKTIYNADSSIVQSIVFSIEKDTVSINCIDKNCVAKYKSHILKEFPLKQLDIEQWAISYGNFSREIRLLKE